MYVEFKSGLGPSEPCNDGTSNECFHLATTFPNLDGRTVLPLWEKGNIPPYGHIGTIDWANFARLDWLLKHELGHVLGLHHESVDACRGSVMIGDHGVVLEQGEGRVLPAHCYTLRIYTSRPIPSRRSAVWIPSRPAEACLAIVMGGSRGRNNARDVSTIPT